MSFLIESKFNCSNFEIIACFSLLKLENRERKMLDFAVKITEKSYKITEYDREELRQVGFSDKDIWDISAVSSFFNMSNRMASAVDMRPNSEYHKANR